MDRNSSTIIYIMVFVVALRKESVDRNLLFGGTDIPLTRVALRKESVDRNLISLAVSVYFAEVALRKESVDRNYTEDYADTMSLASLSARRAWIEMRLDSEY